MIAGAILLLAAVAAAGGGWAWRRGRAWPSEPRFFPLPQPGVRIWVPVAGADRHQGEVRLRGGSPVTLWLESPAALPATVFAVTNLTGGPIDVRCTRAGETITLGQVAPQESSRKLLLTPQQPDRVRPAPAAPSYLYRLRITAGAGEPGDGFAAALAYLGPREFVERDLYALAWDGCGAPSPVRAGEEFLAVVRLRNLSPHPWPHRGNARVRLSYRWLAADGRTVPHDGLPTELDAEVAPGAELASWQRVQAPPEPGPYLLELDPVFERVARFSSRNGGLTCRAAVDVIASPQARPPATGAFSQGADPDPTPTDGLPDLTPKENPAHDHRSTQGNPSP